jgi:hypothetical protein
MIGQRGQGRVGVGAGQAHERDLERDALSGAPWMPTNASPKQGGGACRPTGGLVGDPASVAIGQAGQVGLHRRQEHVASRPISSSPSTRDPAGGDGGVDRDQRPAGVALAQGLSSSSTWPSPAARRRAT